MEVQGFGGTREIIIWNKKDKSSVFICVALTILHLHLNTFTYETDYLCSFPLYVALCRTGIAGAKHPVTL